MRKLLFATALLALGTACPKVERRVYTFDLKSGTGSLRFENIFTDAPDSANADFMDVVNQVLRGTKIEEEFPGWAIEGKRLFDNEGRLDGEMRFGFDSLQAAGLYQHDKKSAILWCASRVDEEVIVRTNGKRLDDVLPGCVAWDRKTRHLEVMVRTATLSGGERSLIDAWRRWAGGEELPVEPSAGTGLEGFNESFASNLVEGLSQSLASHAELTVGEASGTGTPADLALLGPVQRAGLRLCMVSDAVVNHGFEDTVELTVQPDGTWAVKLRERASLHPDELHTCATEVLGEVSWPARDEAWTLTVPLSTRFKGPQ